MKRLGVLMIAAALTLTALPSFADDAQPAGPPVRLRAIVLKFDDGILAIQTDKEENITLAVTPQTNISGVAMRSVTDIKPNDFIGVTAITGKDGKMTATEVHMFPEAMRGAGEGHYPWGNRPNATMTNAAVSGMVDSSDGKSFTLGYKNRDGSMGSSVVRIPLSTPTVIFVAGDKSLLVPGAHMVIFAHKNPDNSLVALGIVAEKDGVVPPM
jgi:hypothetical protein